jgi:hypothetical protein
MVDVKMQKNSVVPIESSSEEVNLYAPTFEDIRPSLPIREGRGQDHEAILASVDDMIAQKERENTSIKLEVESLEAAFEAKRQKLMELNKLKVKFEMERDLMQARIQEIDRLCQESAASVQAKGKPEFLLLKPLQRSSENGWYHARESLESLKLDYSSSPEQPNYLAENGLLEQKPSDSVVTHKKEYKRIRNNFTESMPSIYQNKQGVGDYIQQEDLVLPPERNVLKRLDKEQMLIKVQKKLNQKFGHLERAAEDVQKSKLEGTPKSASDRKPRPLVLKRDDVLESRKGDHSPLILDAEKEFNLSRKQAKHELQSQFSKTVGNTSSKHSYKDVALFRKVAEAHEYAAPTSYLAQQLQSLSTYCKENAEKLEPKWYSGRGSLKKDENRDSTPIGKRPTNDSQNPLASSYRILPDFKLSSKNSAISKVISRYSTMVKAKAADGKSSQPSRSRSSKDLDGQRGSFRSGIALPVIRKTDGLEHQLKLFGLSEVSLRESHGPNRPPNVVQTFKNPADTFIEPSGPKAADPVLWKEVRESKE